jgi:hypothetical protein
VEAAVDCGASQIMVVLLSPYHDFNDPYAEMPEPPSGVVGRIGHLLDLTITATFENDFEQMCKINRQVRERGPAHSHRQVKAALIGPESWLPVTDIVRYR